jgi:glucuronokinase
VAEPVVVEVPARAALAGNPSDLYGGAVLAIPVPSLRARVEIVDAPATTIADRLIRAAAARVDHPPGEIRWTTAIPRRVGLAGSSALVIAVLRASLQRAGRTLAALEVAELARSVEADDLGIRAGLQDRCVQAAEAPVLVDVSRRTPSMTLLTPKRPLRFVVAWLESAAADSGEYHAAIARSIDRVGMAELADVARRAAVAFTAGDAIALAGLMAKSADMRSRIAPLPAEHERLADAVRAAGLSPNSAGSGGSVVAVAATDDELGQATRAVASAGGQWVVETCGLN